MIKINLFTTYTFNLFITAILLIVLAFSSGKAVTQDNELINEPGSNDGDNYAKIDLTYSILDYQQSLWDSIVCHNNLFAPPSICFVSTSNSPNQNSMMVGDFTLTANPTSRTVNQGEKATYSITIQSTGGFNSPVSLAALNLPGNQVLPGTGFSPQTVTPPTNGSTTSTLNIVTNNQTPTGNFTITVRGTGGGITKDRAITLTVNAPNFSVSALPSSRTVAQGNSATYNISLNSIGGFSGTVNLTALNLPGNQVLPGTGFSPSQVTLSSGSTASSTLTIVTNNQTPTGNFTITIRGTSGSLIREVPVGLTVTSSQNFSISASPSSRTVIQGNSASYTVTVQSIGGFNSAVSLTALNLPDNQVLPGTGFSPQSVTPPSNNSAASTFTIVTNNQTPTGNFTIIIRGTSGSLIRETTVSLTVNQSGDFNLSVSPTSRTITQGGTAIYQVTLQSINGFSGTVSLTALNLPGNQVLPGTGFNPSLVTLAPNGSANSTLGIATNNQTPIGNFTITIRAISGSLVKEVTVSLIVNSSGNFTLSVSPTSRTVTLGSSATFGVTVSGSSFNGTVVLTALNLPGNQVLPGTGFNPVQVTLSGNNSASSTLTIVTNNQTPTGNFTITIRGTGNGIVREIPVTLTVNASNPAPSISNITSPVQVNQTTNLIINGANFQNNFSASVMTASGTFQIAAAGLTFVNSNQVRVQVTMGGVPPYTATMRITNPDGQNATGQFQVVSTTNPPPSITSISPSQIPVSQTRILTVSGQNFRPNFSVKVQGFDIAPVGLTFVNSGEVRVQVTMGGTPPYQASLVLTNPDGQTVTSSFNVNNSPPNSNSPTASFAFAPGDPNVNQTVQFTSTATGQSLSYAWDFQSDGVTDSVIANPTFIFTTAATRRVTLRVTNSNGSDEITRTVNVGSNNTATPVITNVFRTYEGLYFLKNTNFTNFFDVRVNWNGTPGTVRFQINNNPSFVRTGTANGRCEPFSLSDSLFAPSLSPSVIKITPINAQGVAGDTSFQPVYILPYPRWLEDAVGELGEQSVITRTPVNSQNGCSINLLAPATNGLINVGVNYKFPTTPISARINQIPGFVPLFGGHALGITNAQASFSAMASNNGTGRIQLNGRGGFEAMGSRLDELRISGSGDIVKNGSGFRVTNAAFNLDFSGTLRKQVGILQAIPQLSFLASYPVFSQINNSTNIVGEVTPTLRLGANWYQDVSTGQFKFREGTGTFGLRMGATVTNTSIPFVTLRGSISGSGESTLGFPQQSGTYLRSATFSMRAEAYIKIPLVIERNPKAEYTCRWTHTNQQAICPQTALMENLANADDFRKGWRSVKYEYEKFGDYEVFHPNAEETNLIEEKKDSQALSAVSESNLINNLYPDAEPILLEAGNSRMLLWVRQNPNLPTKQSTEIAWSYNNGTNWSNPAVIVTDTRAEFSPVAGVDVNGKIVAAWLRIKDPAFSINIETFEQMPLFFKEMEVVSAVFNPSTGTWSAETVLTDDLVFDTSLNLSADNTGKLLLTWQSNPSGEFIAGSANPATLKFSFWNGSNWNAPDTVANNLVNVNKHTAAVRGNSAFIIVPRDPDIVALNDRTLDLYTWNGSAWSQASTFAGGSVDNFLPSAIYDSNGQGQIVWRRGSDLVQATLSNPVFSVVREGSDSLGFYNTHLLGNPQGNLTLVWQEVSDNGPANIFARLYDTASQTWSSDLRLNDSDWLSKSVSGYYGSDGKLRMAYLATQIFRRTETVTIGGEPVVIENIPEDGQTDLRLLEHSLIRDLATTDTDLTLSPQFPRAGEQVTATLKLRNAGDFSLNNFNIKLYAGNPSSGGTLLGSTRVTETVAAGETRTVTMSFGYPQPPRNIVAVIDADNEISEFSESNNRATVYFENTPPVAIATANVTSGNSPLAVNFNASSSYDSDGDALSFGWSFADGSPSATGSSVSHTFEQTGLYPVTVSVTDARGAVSTATVNVSVNCSVVTITPSTLPNGATVAAYSQNLSATGGTAPYLFAVTSGALPAGLTLAANGLLSGTPTEAGIFNFTITTTYANGCPGTGDYTLIINQSRRNNFDFDGDGKSDVSVFRPDNGVWYLQQSNSGFTGVEFGISTDKLVPADYDGDGKTDIAVFRSGTWYLQRSQLGFTGVAFGDANDIPQPADYDGDGKADIAVFRPSTGVWYLLQSTAGFTGIAFGQNGDKPVAADYDGDGKADVAVFRNGTWYLQRSTFGFTGITFGEGTDKPVAADYDGDGKADVAVFRPANGVWYLQQSTAGFTGVAFGLGTDLPTPADYDGDGKTDIAVFRNGAWYLQRSTQGFTGIAFGAATDKPVPNAFVP